MGNRWERDQIDGEGIIVIECHRYTSSKQNQGQLASLTYIINDTGANGGIIVSGLGLQCGAKLVAEAENITEVEIAINSTIKEYVMKFLGKVMIGMTTLGKEIRSKIKNGGNIDAASNLGEMFAKEAIKKGIKKVCFDRGGYLFHGRVKAFAEAARKAGMEF